MESKTIPQLKAEITKIWYDIPNELCQKLVLSMKKRIIECLNAKGQHTSY